jgi:hypothetical protein
MTYNSKRIESKDTSKEIKLWYNKYCATMERAKICYMGKCTKHKIGFKSGSVIKKHTYAISAYYKVSLEEYSGKKNIIWCPLWRQTTHCVCFYTFWNLKHKTRYRLNF